MGNQKNVPPNFSSEDHHFLSSPFPDTLGKHPKPPRGDSDYISILSPLEITHFFSSYIDPTFLMAPFSAEVAEERGRSREESAANGA